MRWRRLWFALGLLALPGCELITRAAEYRARPSYRGLCNACGERSEDILRPPCPPKDLQAGGGEGQDPRRVYAWRRLSMGSAPVSPGDLEYDVGFDQDCSTRADRGLPAWCRPVPHEEHAIPSPPWFPPLPRGIDNSLGQRIIAPALAFSQTAGLKLDVEATLNAMLEAGQFSGVFIVDNWNGTPDDPDVTVTIANGLSSAAPPRWDGNDVWVPDSDPSAYPHYPAYVVKGVLVADTRTTAEDDVRITLLNRQGRPVTFLLPSRLAVYVAALTPDAATVVTYARWFLADALAESDRIADFIAGDSPPDASDPLPGILRVSLRELLQGAADLPLGEAPTPDQKCAAISMALRFQGLRARLPDSP